MSFDITPSMQAIEIKEFGGPDVLTTTTRPTPTPSRHEVLIAVKAAGVNRPDCVQRQGLYPAPPGASDIPGLEIAGRIVAVGNAVQHLKPGDDVCALVTGGGYAEYCLADARLCLPIPDGLTMAEAAALPETYFTVWSNVFDRGGLKAGEHFLVHGGTSGIGTTAIQLAKHFGAIVYTTAGNDENCQRCLELGADMAINYKTENFVDVLKEKTDKKGMNLILDMVGAKYTAANLKSLGYDGRLVQIAVMTGIKAEIDIGLIMRRRLTFTGSTLRPRDIDFKAAIAENLRKHVWPLIEQGRVAPVMDQQFPLTRAGDAHARMESSKHIGKIILTT